MQFRGMIGKRRPELIPATAEVIRHRSVRTVWTGRIVRAAVTALKNAEVALINVVVLIEIRALAARSGANL